MTPIIEQLAQEVGTQLEKRKWRLATAESCTAGGLAYSITAIPGSSAWFEQGWVTYSNLAKEELLKVSPSTLYKMGSVSEQTAREMAEGALRCSHAQISVATTGIAGPGGGSPHKPVGTVWFAFAGLNFATQTTLQVFSGRRQAIREEAITMALLTLLDFIKEK